MQQLLWYVGVTAAGEGGAHPGEMRHLTGDLV